MSADGFCFWLRWLLRELVEKLLRPVFLRYRDAARAGDAEAALRGELRFLRLLDAADCYPFRVSVDRCGLWIEDADAWESYYEDMEASA